jgi:hypothetical protein
MHCNQVIIQRPDYVYYRDKFVLFICMSDQALLFKYVRCC